MKKLIFTLAVCLFALNGMAQKKDWAGFGRFAKENAQVEVRPDAVFMGNSITEGWAYQDPEFFKQNNFVGRGISGQTSAQMLCRFRPDVLAHNPKCVVIMAGTNDVAENNGYISHENILNNIISMVQLAQANDIKVILCSVPPTSVFGWRPDLKPGPTIVELNKLIKAWADENKVYYFVSNLPLLGPIGDYVDGFAPFFNLIRNTQLQDQNIGKLTVNNFAVYLLAFIQHNSFRAFTSQQSQTHKQGHGNTK